MSHGLRDVNTFEAISRAATHFSASPREVETKRFERRFDRGWHCGRGAGVSVRVGGVEIYSWQISPGSPSVGAGLATKPRMHTEMRYPTLFWRARPPQGSCISQAGRH